MKTNNKNMMHLIAGVVLLFINEQTSLASLTCPKEPTATELYSLIDRSLVFTGVRFVKIEETDADVLAWRFTVSTRFTHANIAVTDRISFFSKALDDNTKKSKADKKIEKAPYPYPKFNDRFLVIIENKAKRKNGASKTAQQNTINLLAGALDNYFTKPRQKNSDACIIESNVYLEDFLRRHMELKSMPDRTCKILLQPLESKPIIKDATKFRCLNPSLERKRITLLAQSYATAGRYGNAITALELSHGNLNAATTLQSLEWINQWQKKDQILAKRFCRRILSKKNRIHLLSTRQSRAVDDVLNEPKKYEALRATDWFGPLVSQWIAIGSPSK